MRFSTTVSNTRRSLLAALIIVAAVAINATHLMASITLPDLPAGTQYQIIFETADTTTATDTVIGDYNSFVTTEANSNAILLALGVQWNAVVSTPFKDAFSNAPSSGLPVYNTDGIEVASAATGLYTSPLLSPIMYDQNGDTGPVDIVWTGSLSSGLAAGHDQLGQAFVEIGNATDSTSWAVYGDREPDLTFPLYALSTPITAVPEPSSITLFGSAPLLLGGFRWLQQRRGTFAIRATRLPGYWHAIPTA